MNESTTQTQFQGLPPPPQGQVGVNPNQLSSLPPPPKGQMGMTLEQYNTTKSAQGGLAEGGALGQEPPVGINTGGVFGFNDLANVGKDVIKGTSEAVGAFPSQFASSAERGAETMGRGGILNAIKGTGQAFLGAAGSAAGTLLSPLSSLFGSIAKKTGVSDAIDSGVVKPLASALSNVPAFQEFAISHPNAETDIQNINNLLNVGALETTPKNILNEKIPSPTEVASNIKEALPKIQANLETKYTNKALNDWKEPIKTNEAKFNKATDIYNNSLNKGNDIADTLVKNKINLDNNIEKGKYATADTADQIRADAQKISNEVLRPALEQADYTTPKIPVSEVVKTTIENIKNSKGVTPGDMEAQITKAETEGKALERKYPDGMGLVDMHDNRISYNSNRYSPLGAKSDANAANVDRSFGRTLGKLVENNAPKEIPVHQFQQELQKQFQAADYLEALDTKKVPTSVLQTIAKTSAKVAGAITGHGLGGGLLGGVGGYHIGGMVESLFENMPNPIKGYFLDNLSKTNPEAFNAIRNYLGAEQSAQLMRKALPAGNQIPLGPKTSQPIYGRPALPDTPAPTKTINPQNMDILPKKK